MNIHEYQAKKLFEANGILIPKGQLVESPLEADFAFRRLNSEMCVVKAQIHAGGRGKAGGVKLVKSPEECAKVTQEMLGKTLVKVQTGPQGKKVHKVYIETASKIQKEYYLAMTVDRENAAVALIFSTEGGMDIEEIAVKKPAKLKTVTIQPSLGVKPYVLRNLFGSFELPKEEVKKLEDCVRKLYAMFMKHDFSLLEINPLILDGSGNFMPLDGKMAFDDNALFRQGLIQEMRDLKEEDLREIEASKYGLNYIGLDGTIGCLVNGAGLAMATMDIIKFYGGLPANFLDVGGGASEDMVKRAFRIILLDHQVKGVFVNIFGGIMRCDTIAKGILAAARELGLNIPLVVRLQGTHVELGCAMLKDSEFKIETVQDMAEGAEKIVRATQQKRGA